MTLFLSIEQEKQDDAVALAVEQMKPLKMDLTDTPALTDKTFDTFLDAHKVAIVAFTVKCKSISMSDFNDGLALGRQSCVSVDLGLKIGLLMQQLVLNS